MPFTVPQLEDFAYRRIKPVADALGWTVAGGDLLEPVRDAVRNCGAAVPVSGDIDVADDLRLEAEAVVAALQHAAIHAASRYDFTVEGRTVNRSQMLKGIEAALTEAERRLAAVGGGAFALLTGTVTYDDEYAVPSASEFAVD